MSTHTQYAARGDANSAVVASRPVDSHGLSPMNWLAGSALLMGGKKAVPVMLMGIRDNTDPKDKAIIKEHQSNFSPKKLKCTVILGDRELVVESHCLRMVTGVTKEMLTELHHSMVVRMNAEQVLKLVEIHHIQQTCQYLPSAKFVLDDPHRCMYCSRDCSMDNAKLCSCCDTVFCSDWCLMCANRCNHALVCDQRPVGRGPAPQCKLQVLPVAVDLYKMVVSGYGSFGDTVAICGSARMACGTFFRIYTPMQFVQTKLVSDRLFLMHGAIRVVEVLLQHNAARRKNCSSVSKDIKIQLLCTSGNILKVCEFAFRRSIHTMEISACDITSGEKRTVESCAVLDPDFLVCLHRMLMNITNSERRVSKLADTIRRIALVHSEASLRLHIANNVVPFMAHTLHSVARCRQLAEGSSDSTPVCFVYSCADIQQMLLDMNYPHHCELQILCTGSFLVTGQQRLVIMRYKFVNRAILSSLREDSSVDAITCWGCNILKSNHLRLCGGCGVALYCCRSCQKADRENHICRHLHEWKHPSFDSCGKEQIYVDGRDLQLNSDQHDTICKYIRSFDMNMEIHNHSTWARMLEKH